MEPLGLAEFPLRGHESPAMLVDVLFLMRILVDVASSPSFVGPLWIVALPALHHALTRMLLCGIT